MRNGYFKRVFVICFVSVLSVIWLSGCVHHKQTAMNEPVMIKNAAIGLNILPDGKLIFVDKNGEVVKPLPFKSQIDRKYKKDPNWKIEEISTITIYRVSGSHELWFYQCGECACYLFSDDWSQFLGRCH